MAETETDVAKSLKPEALVSEIERTRAELARTIDQIADRVSPAKVAGRTTDQIKRKIASIDPLIAGGAALAVVSVAAFVIWRKVRK